ncbi:hypothetical protein BJY59DRAFT_718465, partial [Rhodotorula toruloides]
MGANTKAAIIRVRLLKLSAFTSGKTFDELEKELLNGQELQGVATAEEIYAFLKARGRLHG